MTGRCHPRISIIPLQPKYVKIPVQKEHGDFYIEETTVIYHLGCTAPGMYLISKLPSGIISAAIRSILQSTSRPWMEI